MHVVCGVASGARRRAPRTCSRLSTTSMQMNSPSMYLYVGDICAIVNWLAAGGPDFKVMMMDNNSPFLVEFAVIIIAYNNSSYIIEQAY
jgi:hypothetical protein